MGGEVRIAGPRHRRVSVVAMIVVAMTARPQGSIADTTGVLLPFAEGGKGFLAQNLRHGNPARIRRQPEAAGVVRR